MRGFTSRIENMRLRILTGARMPGILSGDVQFLWRTSRFTPVSRIR
jgi:hypothetical protein